MFVEQNKCDECNILMSVAFIPNKFHEGVGCLCFLQIAVREFSWNSNIDNSNYTYYTRDCGGSGFFSLNVIEEFVY